MIFIWFLRIVIALYLTAIIIFLCYMTPLIVADRKWLKAHRLLVSYNCWIIHTKQSSDLMLRVEDCLPPCHKTPVREAIFRPYIYLFKDRDVRNSLKAYLKSDYYKTISEWIKIAEKEK